MVEISKSDAEYLALILPDIAKRKRIVEKDTVKILNEIAGNIEKKLKEDEN